MQRLMRAVACRSSREAPAVEGNETKISFINLVLPLYVFTRIPTVYFSVWEPRLQFMQGHVSAASRRRLVFIPELWDQLRPRKNRLAILFKLE